MKVLPVLDLKGGVVVRARAGDRASYRPIETPLARGSDPVDIARGFLNLFPFPALYVADLDAITGVGSNLPAIARLHAAFPGQPIWIDSGAADVEAVEATLANPSATVVIGSESQKDDTLIRRRAQRDRVALSLDYRGDAFLGPAGILSSPEIWAGRVLVMTLARVGGGAGPDFARLAEILLLAGEREVYAAGGVRDAGDLEALSKMNVSGALVATALHDGRITARELRALATSSSLRA